MRSPFFTAGPDTRPKYSPNLAQSTVELRIGLVTMTKIELHALMRTARSVSGLTSSWEPHHGSNMVHILPSRSIRVR